LRCIYSDELLARVEALDHYVPWSFVLHDRIWNLVPVTSRANSSKGDRLAASVYLDRLVDLQCQALIASRQHLAKRAWERMAEEFEQDLRVPGEILRADPPDREALHRSLADAYRKTIPALENLATRQGFPSGWTYSRR
ncbi:MAG TPA: HNH endonuclease domain-containing protein, partial [Haliangium sp.]|nr:HNH endonuclease domain-containing protein [Haliangium sp.]